MFPVASDPGGPGQLGDDPRHGHGESLKVGPPSNDRMTQIGIHFTVFTNYSSLYPPRAYFHISTIQFNPSSVLAQHSEYPSLPFKYGGAALLVQTIPPLHFLILSFNLN